MKPARAIAASVGLILGLTVFGSGSAQAIPLGSRDGIDFEDLAPGTIYHFGSQLLSAGRTMQISAFFPPDRGYIPEMFFGVRVEEQLGMGTDVTGLLLANASLDFGLVDPAVEISLDVTTSLHNRSEVVINGAHVSFSDLDELNGLRLGGALVSVRRIPAWDHRCDPGMVCAAVMPPVQLQLVISGVISSFQIAGENLWLDNFVSTTAGSPVPEPGSMLLFGAGLLGLHARRRLKTRMGRH